MPVGSRCAEALGLPPAGLWGSPHHLAGRSPWSALASRFERTVDHLVLPPRWSRWWSWRVSVSRSFRSSPTSLTAPFRCGIGDSGPTSCERQEVFTRSTGCPPTFFRFPQSAAGCPEDDHRRAHSGTVPERDEGPVPERTPALRFRSGCGREDLNLHGITPTATSTLRVCQFRHDRSWVESGSVPATFEDGEPVSGHR
jgi:hypothetical protein